MGEGQPNESVSAGDIVRLIPREFQAETPIESFPTGVFLGYDLERETWKILSRENVDHFPRHWWNVFKISDR